MNQYSKGSANISLTLPNALKEQLERFAQANGMSRNGVIVEAIRRLIQKYRKEAPPSK